MLLRRLEPRSGGGAGSEGGLTRREQRAENEGNKARGRRGGRNYGGEWSGGSVIGHRTADRSRAAIGLAGRVCDLR